MPGTADPLPARRRRFLRTAGAASVLAVVAFAPGCALFAEVTPPRVTVVGVERLAGEGFEFRFNVKLRVQNPNPRDIDYDGLAIDLDVNGRPLATGVSPEKGTIGRFGEAVLAVPVTVNAVATVRQLLGLGDGVSRGELPYAIRGRLGGGPFGGMRFSSEGVLRLAP